MNILNGGAHADNCVDFQEFMILPVGSNSIADAVRVGADVFHTLRGILKQKGLNTSVGDEGGFAPEMSSNEAAIELILESIQRAGYEPGADVALALDPASTELFKDGNYLLEKEGHSLSSEQLAELWADWVDRYPIISIEDGMAEDDWQGWAQLTNRIGDQAQIVGDDLLVTNPERLRRGISEGSANSILIKVNQIGTLTETLQTIKMAHGAGWTTVISHRSGAVSYTHLTLPTNREV